MATAERGFRLIASSASLAVFSALSWARLSCLLAMLGPSRSALEICADRLDLVGKIFGVAADAGRSAPFGCISAWIAFSGRHGPQLLKDENRVSSNG
jgi:hypothetical protein